jgi:hypothetical protein
MFQSRPLSTECDPSLGLDRALASAVSLSRRCAAIPRTFRLEDDLAHLERLQGLAAQAPDLWRVGVAARRHELALWVYGVAMAVASLGLYREALALLDVLPEVPAGADGRKELLEELLTHATPERAAA